MKPAVGSLMLVMQTSPPARPTISRAMISLWPEPKVWIMSPRATTAPRSGASCAIVDAFAFDTNYTEKEVNTILRRFHVDTAALRRYLVDNGLMARESNGTKYWRVSKETK